MDAAHALAAPLFLCALAASWAMTALVLRLLLRRRILDHPNERSSHATATPRGGGLGVVAVVLIGWLVTAIAVAAPAPADVGWLVLGGAALALVSWIDDLRALPPLPRLAVQIFAVALGLAALARHGPVFQGALPAPLDLAAAGALWLWFINLFNFMDGIDGLAGVEAGAVGLGLFAATVAAGHGVADAGLPAVVLAGAAVGFLWWNWHPARVFLGDVGSVPLGYLLGWLLLAAAAEGLWQAALILPLYFLADASITLVRRAARGAAPWRAHREHFYQKAVIRGLSHARVAGVALAANVVLVALAVAAAAAAPAPGGGSLWALAAAALVVSGLLGYLAVARRSTPDE